MFTKQANQIESALRLGGSGQQSAKEMVQAIANCAQPLEHRAPLTIAPTSNVFPGTFILPPGLALHQSVSKSAQFLPDQNAPLWHRSPAQKKTGHARQAAMQVSGPVIFGDVRAGDARLGSLSASGVASSGDLVASGSSRVAGNASVGGSAAFAGQASFDGPLTTFAGAIHRDGVVNQASSYTAGEAHFGGPVAASGGLSVGSESVEPQSVSVVVDVVWDGNILRKKTRQILVVAGPGAQARREVLNCDLT